MKIVVPLLCFFTAFLAGVSDSSAQQVVPQSRAQITLSYAPLVKAVTPAVVNIYTKKLVKQRGALLFDDPIFRQFFGDGIPYGMTRDRFERSLGSGVIVRSDGMIVTSQHVVEGADQIRVVLSDRREFDARLVMSDEHADLAVLRVDAKGESLPHLELKDSDEAQVGDLVLAIGNPFGVGQTVTSGIVSALTHRTVGASDLGYYIQTDAAINPGNSGGALVTMDGKLIGINAAIYTRDGGNMGIGFAVPSNMVRVLIGAVVQGKKKITHPWTGIDGQEISQNIALSLGLSQPMGLLVKSMHPSSPAAAAGLRKGDVVVSVNGKDIEDPKAFGYRIAELTIGSQAEFGIIRAGQKIALRVPMIEPPEDPPRNETEVKGLNPVVGAKIANLSPAVAADLGIPSMDRGVVVTQVKRGTVAARMGLAAGDILSEINGYKIENVDDALLALKGTRLGWRLKVRRGNGEMTLMLN